MGHIRVPEWLPRSTTRPLLCHSPVPHHHAVCRHIVTDAAVTRTKCTGVLYHTESLYPGSCSTIHNDRGTKCVLFRAPLVSRTPNTRALDTPAFCDRIQLVMGSS